MDRKYIARLILLNPYFLVALFLVSLNELNLGITKSIFISSYLNDLLASCILLTLTSLILSLFYKSIYIISKAQLLFFFVYLSFVFELLLPYLSSSFIADKYDILAYAIGTLLFYYLINKKLNEFKRDYKASKKCEA